MGEKTGIRWCDSTENPIKVKDKVTGKFGGFYCIKISPGCTNCYAASMVGTGRFGEIIPYVAGPNAPELYLDREMLAGWAKKGKAKKRFVSSMTDIFGEFVPDEWVFDILDAQLNAPKQTFLNLTKRASRAFELVGKWMDWNGLTEAPANMWMGFSAEDQERFDERWAYFYSMWRNWGFTVWVSAEPLIGSVVLPQSFLRLGKKAWCVAGGESGAKARIMRIEWARSLRNQCVEFGVPFFFKQWGNHLPVFNSYTTPDGFDYVRMDKHAAGYDLDGVEWSMYPDSPSLAIQSRF